MPLCVLSTGLALNTWVGYFPIVRIAWNQQTAGPLPHETDLDTIQTMQKAGTVPDHGSVVPGDIPSTASGFKHRRQLVYLPPRWFASNPAPELPVVMMIGREFNTGLGGRDGAGNPGDQTQAANALCCLGREDGITCPVVPTTGRHDWPGLHRGAALAGRRSAHAGRAARPPCLREHRSPLWAADPASAHASSVRSTARVRARPSGDASKVAPTYSSTPAALSSSRRSLTVASSPMIAASSGPA